MARADRTSAERRGAYGCSAQHRQQPCRGYAVSAPLTGSSASTVLAPTVSPLPAASSEPTRPHVPSSLELNAPGSVTKVKAKPSTSRPEPRHPAVRPDLFDDNKSKRAVRVRASAWYRVQMLRLARPFGKGSALGHGRAYSSRHCSLIGSASAQSASDPAAARALFAEARKLMAAKQYDQACPKVRGESAAR